jgi:hypothetical protein
MARPGGNAPEQLYGQIPEQLASLHRTLSETHSNLVNRLPRRQQQQQQQPVEAGGSRDLRLPGMTGAYGPLRGGRGEQDVDQEAGAVDGGGRCAPVVRAAD